MLDARGNPLSPARTPEPGKRLPPAAGDVERDLTAYLHDLVDNGVSLLRRRPIVIATLFGAAVGLGVGVAIDPTGLGTGLAIAAAIWFGTLAAAVAIAVHNAKDRKLQPALLLVAPVCAFMSFSGAATATTSVRSRPLSDQAQGASLSTSSTSTVPPSSTIATPAQPPTTLPPWMSECAERDVVSYEGAVAAGLPEDMWPELSRIVDEQNEYGLCIVRVSTNDWLTDVALFSNTSGPGGHIVLARFDGATVRGQFVPPLIGFMEFSQMEGMSVEDWGFPGAPVPCGTGQTSLVLYHDRSGHLSGYALWTVTPTASTKFSDRASAWFTPMSIAGPLVADLVPKAPLPMALGSPLGPEGGAYQEFVAVGVVREDGRRVSEKDLLSHC